MRGRDGGHTYTLSRNRIRIFTYGYGALLALGIIVFPRQWWVVLIVWFVVAYGLLTWYFLRLRRARRQNGVGPPAAEKSNIAFLRRLIPALILTGASVLLLGATVMTLGNGGPTTAHLVSGSLLLLFGVAILVWAALLRFRGPSGGS